jgi:hypothetical protein
MFRIRPVTQKRNDMTALQLIVAACGFATALALPTPSARAEPLAIAGVAGEWRGHGTDRNSGNDQAKPVSCRASNEAGENTLRIKMSCEGASGREDVTADLTVNEPVVSGSMTRRSSDLPFAVSGSVKGITNGNQATFDVTAFFKTRARITVALVSRSIYRLLVREPDGGATLMHVTFRKS